MKFHIILPTFLFIVLLFYIVITPITIFIYIYCTAVRPKALQAALYSAYTSLLSGMQ